MVIPAPIFRQLIMIDPDFSLGKIKVYLDALALTSRPDKRTLLKEGAVPT